MEDNDVDEDEDNDVHNDEDNDIDEDEDNDEHEHEDEEDNDDCYKKHNIVFRSKEDYLNIKLSNKELKKVVSS